tara:strand:- start:205 stop:354 length:150 start_codon:yes stop_codon:yes gene_type:complete
MIPNQIKSIIEKLDYFIIENEKEMRRFIKNNGHKPLKKKILFEKRPAIL